MSAKTKNRNKSARSSHKHKPKGVSSKSFERVYWPYLPLVLVVSVLLMMSGQSGALHAALKNPTGGVLAYATSMSSGGLLSSTNAERSEAGAGSLKINSKLASAAQAKANDMAERNYWSHNTPDGDPPWVFVSAKGYNYQKLGENLAAGFSTEPATIAGWMASPAHKDNLLDPAFTEVGFGYANNANYTSAGGGPMTVVVAMYGKPTVLASQTQSSSPSSTKSTKPAAPKPRAEAKKETKAEPKKEEPKQEPEEDIATNALQQPFNSDGLTTGAGLATSTSRIQTVLGNIPASNLATGLAVFGLFTAMGLWVSRHALAVRRAVVMGENLALRHPLVDVGLVMIAALLFLLSRTAGFVQ